MSLLSQLKKKACSKGVENQQRERLVVEQQDQSLFLIASYEANSTNKKLRWHWKNLVTYFNTFHKDSQEYENASPQEFLHHRIRSCFVGTRQTIITFLNQALQQDKSQHTTLSNSPEGLYLYKLMRSETYLIIWPDVDGFSDSETTSTLLQVASNLCSEINVILSSQNTGQHVYFYNSKTTIQTLDAKQQLAADSAIQKFRLSSSSLLISAYNSKHSIMLNKTADVFTWIGQELRKGQNSVRFRTQFWKKITDLESDTGAELAVVCALYPKLGLQLYRAVYNRDSATVDKLIGKIEQSWGENLQGELYEIESVAYDYITENMCVNLFAVEKSCIAYSLTQAPWQGICLDKLGEDFRVLEVFWGEQGQDFIVFEQQGNTFVKNSQWNSLWQEQASFDLVCYSPQSKVLSLYSTDQQKIEFLQHTCTGNRHEFLKIYCLKGEGVGSQIINVQVFSKQSGAFDFFWESEDKVSVVSPIFASHESKVSWNVVSQNKDKGAFYVPTTDGDFCFKLYFEDDGWNLDVLVLSTLQSTRSIQKVEQLGSFSPKSTKFAICRDPGSDKQCLIACAHESNNNIRVIKMEIIWDARISAVLSAISAAMNVIEPLKNVQIYAQNREVEEQVKQQQCSSNIPVKLWQDFTGKLLNNDEKHGIHNILSAACTTKLDQEAMTSGLKDGSYTEGDLVWYFNSKKTWIEAQIQDVSQTQQPVVYGVGSSCWEQETTVGGSMLQPRYGRVNSVYNMYDAYAIYTQLVHAFLDSADSFIEKEQCLLQLSDTFDKVAQKVKSGLVSQDCLECLYEPFIKVSFLHSTSKSARELLKHQLEQFPFHLAFPVIDPPFWSISKHVQMIFQVYSCAADDALKQDDHRGFLAINEQLEGFIHQQQIKSQVSSELLQTYQAKIDSVGLALQKSMTKQQQEIDDAINKIRSKQELSTAEFLTFIYSDYTPNGKSLNPSAPVRQQLRNARIHFHPDRVRGSQLERIYREISILINSKT